MSSGYNNTNNSFNQSYRNGYQGGGGGRDWQGGGGRGGSWSGGGGSGRGNFYGGGGFRGRGGFRGGFRGRGGYYKKFKPGGRLSESVRNFYNELYPSDIQIDDLDHQLRIWTAQFLENALESNAMQVEIRFFNNGQEGFDIIDDGEGIKEEDFESLPECLDERATNDMYKTKSIGFKGEALFCLIKSSDVTIMSRHKDSIKAFQVKYDREGQILKKQEISMEMSGTIIEVRNIFEIDAGVSAKYKQQSGDQFDYAITLLNAYSLILFDKTLVVTTGKLFNRNNISQWNGHHVEERVRCKWQTPNCGNFLQNVRFLLQNQFGARLPELSKDLIQIDFKWDPFDISMILARPVLNGKKTFLTKKNCFSYLNKRPVEIQSRVKSVFFEIYNEFKVGTKSMPILLIHFKTEQHTIYEMKMGLDIRSINFSTRQQSELWGLLREKIKGAFIKSVQETPEGEGLSRGEIEKQMRDTESVLRPDDNKRHTPYVNMKDEVPDFGGQIKVIKDEKELPTKKTSMFVEFDNMKKEEDVDESQGRVKSEGGQGEYHPPPPGFTGSLYPSPANAPPGYYPPGKTVKQEQSTSEQTKQPNSESPKPNEQQQPPPGYPPMWQPGMPYPYPYPYGYPPGQYPQPPPGGFPPGQYPMGAYPPGQYPYPPGHPGIPGQQPSPNQPQSAKQEVQIDSEEESSSGSDEGGEDEQEEMDSEAKDQAPEATQPEKPQELTETDKMADEFKAFLSMGYYEFVNRTYLEPYQAVRGICNGKYEVAMKCLEAAIRGDETEASTADASPEKSGLGAEGEHLSTAVADLKQALQTIEGKEDLIIEATIPMNSSRSNDEAASICIITTEAKKTLYATTSAELESESETFRAMPLVALNRDCEPSSLRQLPKRFRRTQLKMNKEYKASRKAKKSRKEGAQPSHKMSDAS